MAADTIQFTSSHKAGGDSSVLAVGKLSASDSQALSDPDMLCRLTDKVSSAMDEAASTLQRIKAEQQKTAPA